MTNLEKNLLLPKSYCIDSFKLSIDVDNFTSIKIPDNFVLIDKDSGEVLQEFKKKSLQVEYKNTTIYLGIHKRILRGTAYTKLIILFSSKVCGVDYFSGIKKQHVIDVLEHIQNLGYIKYTDVYSVFENLYTTDTDIKIDFVFDDKFRTREMVAEYNKDLVKRFQFEKGEIHNYNSVTNLGIQTFNRDRSTLAHPFVKWYDKCKEITQKHSAFFGSLPDDIQSILLNKFVYRFEFTMKDKKMFAKFGITNRLADVLSVDNDKWQSTAKVLLNTLFEYKVKKVRDTSKLNYYEKILALQMVEDLKTIPVNQVKSKYTAPQKDRFAKNKGNALFDKLYQFINDDASAMEELKAKVESIQYFDSVFGFGLPNA